MRKRIIYTVLLQLAIVGLYNNGFSQRNDAGLWLSLELEKLLTQRASLEFKHTARIEQNITHLDLSYSDLGLTYQFSKHVALSGNYRFINKFSPEYNVGIRHRFYCDLVLKKKLKPFVFALRQRFQNQLEDALLNESGNISEYYTRSKVIIKYNLSRFTPCIASELYFKLRPGQQPLPNRYRVYAGCNYSVNKTNDLELYYLFDRRFNQKNPLTNYVIGVTYKHTFY